MTRSLLLLHLSCKARSAYPNAESTSVDGGCEIRTTESWSSFGQPGMYDFIGMNGLTFRASRMTQEVLQT